MPYKKGSKTSGFCGAQNTMIMQSIRIARRFAARQKDKKFLAGRNGHLSLYRRHCPKTTAVYALTQYVTQHIHVDRDLLKVGVRLLCTRPRKYSRRELCARSSGTGFFLFDGGAKK